MDIAELRGLFLFDGLSDAQLGELLAASDEIHFNEESDLFHEGDPADHWWVLLEGKVELLRRTGREQAVLGAMDRPGVWAGGFRAWDESSSYLATGRPAIAGRFLRLPAAKLSELARAWMPFGVHLIGGFFQTVRRMDSLSRQRDALIALGRLAAGMAHEINNPASATARAVDELEAATELARDALRELAEQGLTGEQYLALDTLRRDIPPPAPGFDSLALADREEAVYTWLEARGVETAWRTAPVLAAAGLEVDWCERAEEILGASTLGPGLDWIAATLANRALLSEMKEATARVSSLVDSVKSYSQLDRAEVQEIDVTEGIESTLVMLAHKLGADVEVVRAYDDNVPRIEARPGELNQVWTNLIDNAIDAMDGHGTLTISTRVDGDDLVVDIKDTGAGMPTDVQARAFEPFFTTKDVGKGTGLGLDISRRIVVENHRGEITIDSRPGDTVIHVRLPLLAAAK